MAFENLDPYKTLGVVQSSTDKEIKSAFRRLARQFHPDVNPNNPEAEEKFKEINEAYGILSDPERRAHYDRSGLEGARRNEGQGQGQGWGFSGTWDDELFRGANEIFDSIFGVPFWGPKTQSRKPSQRRGPSVEPESVRERWERSKPIQPEEEESTRSWESGSFTRGSRETNISIADQFEALCRALHHASLGNEDTEFVVVSPFRESSALGMEDYPLWRIRRENGNYRIYVSDVLHEGRDPKTNELSEDFKWYDLNTREGQEWIGSEYLEYIELIRELVLNSERFMQEGGRIQRFNELGKKINLDIGKPLSMSAGIESHLANIKREGRTPEDSFIYRPNERLLLRECDIGLLSILVLSGEGRLESDQVMMLYEERAVKNEYGTITRREKIPVWVIDTSQEPPEILPTRANPFTGKDKRYHRLYEEEIYLMANDIVESGALTEERVRRFTETLRIIGITESDSVVQLRMRREDLGLSERMESIYYDIERSNRYDYGIARVEVDSLMGKLSGIEGVKRNIVEGNIRRLRIERPFPLKEKRRGGIGPEGMY